MMDEYEAIEMDEGEEGLLEGEGDTTAFIKVFTHTGPVGEIEVARGTTLAEFRDILNQDHGVYTSALVALVQGEQVPQDAEGEKSLWGGETVVFTGTVKGG